MQDISRRVNSRELGRLFCRAAAKAKESMLDSFRARPPRESIEDTFRRAYAAILAEEAADELNERPEMFYGDEEGMTIGEIISRWKRKGLNDEASP